MVSKHMQKQSGLYHIVAFPGPLRGIHPLFPVIHSRLLSTSLLLQVALVES